MLRHTQNANLADMAFGDNLTSKRQYEHRPAPLGVVEQPMDLGQRIMGVINMASPALLTAAPQFAPFSSPISKLSDLEKKY